MLKVISEPSNDLNINREEFFYLMTKKPIEFDLINPVTKSKWKRVKIINKIYF